MTATSRTDTLEDGMRVIPKEKLQEIADRLDAIRVSHQETVRRLDAITDRLRAERELYARR